MYVQPAEYRAYKGIGARPGQYVSSPSGSFASAALPEPRLRGLFKVHQERVGAMSRVVALAMGVNAADADMIDQAARLHDVGKLFVSPGIIDKPATLDAGEWQVMHMHTIWGHAVLKGSDKPVLQLAATIALQHHEQWDGGGYPYGLSGDDIHLAARIVAICDVYDALREQRPYKIARTHRQAVDIIAHGDERTRPSMFDPAVLKAFLARQEQCRAIFEDGIVTSAPRASLAA